MNLIDIHSHSAWAIDDGIQSIEDFQTLLNGAKNDNINTIIATPHIIGGIINQDEFTKIKNRLNEARIIAEKNNIKYYFGSELMLDDQYLDVIENNLCFTLAESNYILVEFDLSKPIDFYETEEKLYELIIRGYIPIIAHVERYFKSNIDLKVIKKWIKLGCYIQINRTSIMGLHGRHNQDNANKLLKEGCVHFVASDAHDIQGSRQTILSDAYHIVEKNLGLYNANLLFYENALSVINNENIQSMEISKRILFWKRG